MLLAEYCSLKKQELLVKRIKGEASPSPIFNERETFLVNFAVLDEFVEASAAVNLRGYTFKIRQPRFHLARRKAVYAARSAGPWNILPLHTTETATASIFKDHFYNNLSTVFPHFPSVFALQIAPL